MIRTNILKQGVQTMLLRKLFKIELVFILLLLLFTNHLFALQFQIDQAKVRVKLPPGWSDGGVINVENKSDEPIKMRVYIADWIYKESDGSKNFMAPNTSPLSCADWIKFYPADFSVPAKGKQKVNFVVSVPLDAVGGRYAVLFFEVEAGKVRDTVKGVDVKVYQRLGSLFYVEPEGTVKRQAQLSNFKIDASQGKIKLDVDFQNLGNVDITARGSFDIISGDGFVLARDKFEEVYTLPQNKAHLSKSTPSPRFSKGKYDLVLTFDLDGGVLVEEYQIEVNEKGRIAGVKKIE